MQSMHLRLAAILAFMFCSSIWPTILTNIVVERVVTAYSQTICRNDNEERLLAKDAIQENPHWMRCCLSDIWKPNHVQKV